MRKFIINNGDLIMGCVDFHVELVGKNRDKNNTIGGGRWEWNEDLWGKRVFFFGFSSDFGKVTKEQLMAAWTDSSYLSPSLEDCEVCFSEDHDFDRVLKEFNITPPF